MAESLVAITREAVVACTRDSGEWPATGLMRLCSPPGRETSDREVPMGHPTGVCGRQVQVCLQEAWRSLF